MLKRIFAIGLAVSAFGSLAFMDAAGSDALAAEKGPRSAIPSWYKEMTFEQFKVACARPGDMGFQIAPENIKIRCEQTTLAWMAEDVDISLEGYASLRAELTSTKGNVSGGQFVHETTDQGCTTFVQITRRSSREVTPSCEQVLYAESAAALCRETMKGARQAWVVVDEQATGAALQVCATRDSLIVSSKEGAGLEQE
ncbi:hypothetical protein [Polyangium spumosum]|uniref:DUF3617 family protein n=1 Tax=Polyangium spumosum TaxID=889282 RepID=A0A6N7PG65_9BACT|nr:hypothetical protein [Polyangium spumosum]MRG91008.1 hypothetical protein [Polyangium spumosum]